MLSFRREHGYGSGASANIDVEQTGSKGRRMKLNADCVTGLYTDESPGLKVDPVVVLVLSLVFIFSVVALHSEYLYSLYNVTMTFLTALQSLLRLHGNFRAEERVSV